MAIQLATKGSFTTSPNPNVGCVIVDANDQLIGQGWHKQAGTPHAEVHALAQAGIKAKGATAYVTLEPCSHFGRTPPCAKALIEAGVSKVVAAMRDPNPLVAGKGLAMLADAGIETQFGLLEAEAEALNPGFLTRMRKQRPFVTLKLASSLDGKTAMANGHSQWITGAAARADVQVHRAQSCAILSTAATVLADDASLTVRPESIAFELDRGLEWRQPLRVILDSQNRLTPELTLFQQGGPILLINTTPNTAAFAENVSQWQCPVAETGFDLLALMLELGQRQINSVWVEAGARLTGSLLQAQLVDQFILYQAPKIMGHKGRALLELPEFTHMQQAYALAWQDVRQVGDDLKLTASVNYPNNQ